MASIEQVKGKWDITSLYHDYSENVSIPVKLYYKGAQEVDYTITNNRTTRKSTDWETPLGEAINPSDITFESQTVISSDGTKRYYISEIEWDTITPYNPTKTYTLTVTPASTTAPTSAGTVNLTAIWKEFVDGVPGSENDVTTSASWSSNSTIASVTNGVVTYNNTTTAQTSVTITASYSGKTATATITVPAQQIGTLFCSAGTPTGATITIVSGGSGTYTYTGGTLNLGEYAIGTVVKYKVTKSGWHDTTTTRQKTIAAGNNYIRYELTEDEVQPTYGQLYFSGVPTGCTIKINGTDYTYDGGKQQIGSNYEVGTSVSYTITKTGFETISSSKTIVEGENVVTFTMSTAYGQLYFSGTPTGANIKVNDTDYTYNGGKQQIGGNYEVGTTVDYIITKTDYDAVSGTKTIVEGENVVEFTMSESDTGHTPVITYEFVVSGQVSTGEVDNYSGTTYVGAWIIERTDGTITDRTNVTNSTTWEITAGSSVASVNSNGRVDYENLDINNSVGVTVKGTYDGDSDTVHFNVPRCTARGYINLVGNISVASVITATTEELECFDIDLSTLTATNTSSDSWIRNVYIETGTPYLLRIEADSNREGSGSRTGSIVVSANDIYGNVITAATTFTQRKPSTDDVPCTGMTIEPHGSVTIEDQGNTQQFDLGYEPAFTTQHGCTWYLTDSNGNSVSGDIAYLEEDSDPSLIDVRHLRVGTGATGQTVYLKAVNSYNTNIESNTVNITVKYVGAGNITVTPSSLDSGFGDDRIDTTNGAPYVTATNLRGNLAWRIQEDTSNFIRTAEITDSRLLIYYWGVNTGSQRTAIIRVYDDAAPDTYADVRITQRAYVEPSPNEVKILAIAGETTDGTLSPLAPQQIRFAIKYINNDIVSQAFISIICGVTGKTDLGAQTFAKSSISLPDITVDPLSEVYQIYTISNVEPTGPTTSYNMDIRCVSRYQNLTDSVTGWSGDDQIDAEPDDGTN